MIFNFKNYRDYLKNYLKKLPKHGYGEARRLAAALSVSSTHISHIFAGKKYLSPEQAYLLADYLGLSGLEADYLLELVHYERAGTEKLKKYYLHKLQLLKEKSLSLSQRLVAKKQLSDQERSIFYANALYSAIHVYCSTSARGRTLEELAMRFQLSRKKTSEIVSFLTASSLLAENNGYYSVGQMSTHLESSSPHLSKHHANWRMRAIKAAEDLQESELMYTVNASLSDEDFHLLREQMVEFIKGFVKQIHASPPQEIACFNLDFFKIRN